jgi:hypothetical protein
MVVSKRKGINNEGVSNNTVEPTTTSSTNKFLSSMAGRVFQANEAFDTNNGADEKMWGVWAAIVLTWMVVHSSVYLLVQYGFFRGTQKYYLGEGTFPYYFVPRTLSPAAACLASLKNSDFDISDPHLEKWMDESTLLVLPQTGIWTGPSDIAEYVKYVTHPKFYQVFQRTSPREVTLV